MKYLIIALLFCGFSVALGAQVTRVTMENRKGKAVIVTTTTNKAGETVETSSCVADPMSVLQEQLDQANKRIEKNTEKIVRIQEDTKAAQVLKNDLEKAIAKLNSGLSSKKPALPKQGATNKPKNKTIKKPVKKE